MDVAILVKVARLGEDDVASVRTERNVLDIRLRRDAIEVSVTGSSFEGEFLVTYKMWRVCSF